MTDEMEFKILQRSALAINASKGLCFLKDYQSNKIICHQFKDNKKQIEIMYTYIWVNTCKYFSKYVYLFPVRSIN